MHHKDITLIMVLQLSFQTGVFQTFPFYFLHQTRPIVSDYDLESYPEVHRRTPSFSLEGQDRWCLLCDVEVPRLAGPVQNLIVQDTLPMQ